MGLEVDDSAFLETLESQTSWEFNGQGWREESGKRLYVGEKSLEVSRQ